MDRKTLGVRCAMLMNSTSPTQLTDGTLTAQVLTPAYPFGGARLLTLALPTTVDPMGSSGRYFLARCGAQSELERAEGWQIYFRRPLFVAFAEQIPPPSPDAMEETPPIHRWALIVPPGADPGAQWLAELSASAPLNLIGPLGQSFSLRPLARNLLLLTDDDHTPLLLGLIEPLLDRGGKVTLLVRTPTASGHSGADALRAWLPIPVELRLATSDAEWHTHLPETLRWADQVCAALPNAAYPALAAAIRQVRFRLEPDFAQVLVHTPLPCGVGACLACVYPLADGSFTRACVHGPVLELARVG
jgi:dihydroorotate dehydrogenase electron transfer subunit